MLSVLLLSFFPTALLAADIPNKISTATECKKCPYNLCTNKLVYQAAPEGTPYMNLTCWTEGSEIVGDTTWLKTNDSCYVTQYDIEEYNGDYTTDLPYCGRIPQRLTHAEGRTRYFTECFNAPSIGYTRGGYQIKMYKNEVKLDLTCIVPNATFDGSDVMKNGRTKWYKTASNCYVHETGLWPVRDEKKLEDCGALVDFLSPSTHKPDPPEPTPTASTASPGVPAPTSTSVAPLKAWKPHSSNNTHHPFRRSSASSSQLQRRYLYTDKVGEEYVNCTTGSSYQDRTKGVKRVYQFNETVTLQCGVEDPKPGGSRDSWIMLFTTDFCFIRDDDTWEQLLYDSIRSQRFPHCESFVDEKT